MKIKSMRALIKLSDPNMSRNRLLIPTFIIKKDERLNKTGLPILSIPLFIQINNHL